MELRHLRTFLTVSGALSFTRAAAELGYVQSAVTAHVKALEGELGVKLFDRLGRRVVLTAGGKELRPYARRIVDLSEEARMAVADTKEPSGAVMVSAPEMLCAHRLPQVVKELGGRYPKVTVLFHPNPTGALDAGLQRAIGEGVVEVAFVLEEELGPSDNLVVEPLLEEPLVVVTSPDHPLSQVPSVRPGDLGGAPILFTEKGCAYRRVFERTLSGSGARPVAVAEFTSSEAVKRCAEAGMGVAVLAEASVGAELKAGKLSAPRWEGPDLRVTTYMVWHRDRWISPALEAVLEVARRSIRPFSTAPEGEAPSGGGRTPTGGGVLERA
jgi:DNA-binding transcriptional LysR family regulator